MRLPFPPVRHTVAHQRPPTRTCTCTSNARSKPRMFRPRRRALSWVVRSTAVQLLGLNSSSRRSRTRSPRARPGS